MKPSIGKCDGKNIYIDVNRLLETRLLVTANSGAGKTWLMRRIFEQLYGKCQQIIIDREGDFNTLREKYDYIICAPHDGDVIATPGTAKLLARRLLETEVNAVIDIYDLKPTQRHDFVRLFCDALVNAPKSLWHPVLIGLDEAHIFCPEKGSSPAGSSVADLGSLGRKRGYCLLAATQRLSKLNKDLAAELNNVLVGRIGLDVDLKRAADDLGFYQKEQARSLKTLDEGSFYCYGPALSKEVVKVQVGDIKTTQHKAGQRIMNVSPPPTSKIKRILAKELSDLPAEAERELQTIADYKQEIANLRREITNLKKSGGFTEEDKRQLIEEAIQDKVADIENGLHNDFLSDIGQVEINITTSVGEALDEIKGRIPEILKKSMENVFKLENIHKPYHITPITTAKKTSQKTIARSRIQSGSPVHDPRPTDQLSSSQQKILDRLATLEAFGIPEPHKVTLAAHAGFRPTSGGYANNLSKLKTLGYVDYPGSGHIRLTDSGRAVAAEPINPMSLDEYHGCWFSIVSSSQASILRALIDVYPESCNKNDLAGQLGFSPTSGGYANNLSKLKTLGAVEYPAAGQVKATNILFPGDQRS